MKFSGLRTYLKFLSRHKVYTFVSVVGFAISLTFVILLTVYARGQVSMDGFHENKDRIYMMLRDDAAFHNNPIGDYVMGLVPEVETYTRTVMLRKSVGVSPTEWFDGKVLFADRDFFKIFSFELLEGDRDQVLAGSTSAVLSRSTARRLFGDESPVGKSVLIAGEHQATVTGVMEDFPYNTHIKEPDIILSYPMISINWGGDILDNWGNCSFTYYFMARENADIHSKTGLLLEKFREDYWIYQQGFNSTVSFLPLQDVYYSTIDVSAMEIRHGSLSTTRLYIGIAILILIISILNYINMTVAQAGFRGKEAAVKKLMGSGRGKIVAQHLAESLVMTAIALAIAVGISLLVEPYFNRLLDTRLELRQVLGGPGFIALLAALVGISLVSGIIPALSVSSFSPIEVVKGTLTRKVKAGYSKVLIVFQFTVCIALLIATFFMHRQASYLLNKDVGFNRENIMVMDNVVGDYDALRGLRDRLMQIPGVDKVGFSAGTPIDGGNNHSFQVDGVPVSLQLIRGDTAFVEIFGLELNKINNVVPGEEQWSTYLNSAAVNAIGPDALTGHVPEMGFMTYNGDLGNIHIRSLHTPPGPVAFMYNMEWWPWDVVVKLSSDNVYATGEAVRKAYLEYSGGQAFDWHYADSEIHNWYAAERRVSRVMGTFSILSIIIMVMGVFAMSLYMIRQKEKEIGVRKVSGATVGEILAMLNLQSLARVAIAFVIACPIAWYGIGRWLQSFLYRIDLSVWPFIVAGLIVTALCLASVSWQTLRAARANPVESLKSE